MGAHVGMIMSRYDKVDSVGHEQRFHGCFDRKNFQNNFSELSEIIDGASVIGLPSLITRASVSFTY